MENCALLDYPWKTHNEMSAVLTCCSSFGSLTDFRETADGGTVPERDILLALSVLTDTCCRKPWI